MAYAAGAGVTARVERSNVWRSMFRHPRIDTPRGRALQSFSNFFLHLYPVKVPARVLRLRYSFRLGFITTVLFGILVVTGVYLMFFYTPAVGLGVRRHAEHPHRGRLRPARAQRAPVVGPPDGARRRSCTWCASSTPVPTRSPASSTGSSASCCCCSPSACPSPATCCPWDQLSYWAVTVGTNLVHYVPFLGKTLQRPADRRRPDRPDHAAALLRAARRGAAR